jgi:hypothetical protein
MQKELQYKEPNGRSLFGIVRKTQEGQYTGGEWKRESLENKIRNVDRSQIKMRNVF